MGEKNQLSMRKALGLSFGLLYTLLLGYTSYLVSGELFPRQTMILWSCYVLVVCLYLVVALLFLLGKEGRIVKLLRFLREVLDKNHIIKSVVFFLLHIVIKNYF